MGAFILIAASLLTSLSLLGLCITSVIRKTPFVWTPLAQQQFQTLKQELCSAPVLRLPDLWCPFKLRPTDASQYAIGAVLKQGGHPIAYHLETLSDAKLNYSTYDKELYSIVQALKLCLVAFL